MVVSFPSPYGAIEFQIKYVEELRELAQRFPSPYGAIEFQIILDIFHGIGYRIMFPSPYGAIEFQIRKSEFYVRLM